MPKAEPARACLSAATAAKAAPAGKAVRRLIAWEARGGFGGAGGLTQINPGAGASINITTVDGAGIDAASVGGQGGAGGVAGGDNGGRAAAGGVGGDVSFLPVGATSGATTTIGAGGEGSAGILLFSQAAKAARADTAENSHSKFAYGVGETAASAETAAP